MTKTDDALASYGSRFTCSSAVFSAFSDDLGLDPDTAKKIACSFGAARRGTGADRACERGAVVEGEVV